MISNNLTANSLKFQTVIALLAQLLVVTDDNYNENDNNNIQSSSSKPSINQTQLLLLPLLSILISNLKSYSADQIQLCNYFYFKTGGIDNIRRELLKINGYSELAKANSRNLATKPNLLDTFFKFLPSGIEVRNSIVEGFPAIIDDIAKIMKNSNRTFSAASCLLALYGLPNSPPGKDDLATFAITNVLLNIIQNIKDDIEINFALAALQNLSTMDNVRPILVKQGVNKALEAMSQNQKEEKGEEKGRRLVACLIIALLSATESNAHQNQQHQSSSSSTSKPQEMTATSEIIIKKIIETINTFATTATKEFATSPGFHADCKTILIGLRSLCTNEANTQKLNELNITSIIILLIKNRYNDLLQYNLDTLEQVTKE